MKKWILLTLLMLFASTLFSQENILTVDQAVEMALENNLSLQMSAIELRTKRRNMESVWNNFLPSINASVGVTRSDRLWGDPVPNYMTVAGPSTGPNVYDAYLVDRGEADASTSMKAGLQMSLPINMALGSGIKQVILDYELGQITHESATRQMEVNIRKQFWLIKTLQAGVELEKRNIETLEKRYDQAMVNFENGLIPELSVLSARVELEGTRPNLDKKISELENTLALFKFLLGIPQEESLELDGELTVEIHDFESQELIALHLEDRLDVQDINLQLTSLRNTKMMTGLYNLTPTINFDLTWGTQVADKPFDSDSWDPFYDSLSLSATIVLPLDGFIPLSKKDAQLRELQDGIDSLQLARQQVYENARIQIINLVKTLETSQATLDAYAYSVELAERNYQLNNEAYQLGTVELLEVQSAQDQLYEIRYAVLFEKFNYLSTLLDLELALNSRVEEMGE